MGKRSNFERKELDFYPSPIEAVRPLIPYLPLKSTFCEPCAGAGHLIRHLESFSHKCVSAFDIRPLAEGIRQHDASWMAWDDLNDADFVITNPPWERPVLHQIIERSARLKPTWLLFDSDWAFTKQAGPYLEMCRKMVTVGRVKWIEGSDNTGMDNCCWYLFDIHSVGQPTEFYGK